MKYYVCMFVNREKISEEEFDNVEGAHEHARLLWQRMGLKERMESLIEVNSSSGQSIITLKEQNGFDHFAGQKEISESKKSLGQGVTENDSRINNIRPSVIDTQYERVSKSDGLNKSEIESVVEKIIKGEDVRKLLMGRPISKMEEVKEGIRYNPESFKFKSNPEGIEVDITKFIESPVSYIEGKYEEAELKSLTSEVVRWKENTGAKRVKIFFKEIIPLW